MHTLYAALNETLLVASGTGEDWQLTEHRPAAELQCLAATPAAPERVYCGSFDDGLHRSTNGGESWERIDPTTVPDRVMAATVSPHDPSEIWIGTEPSAVFVSTDAGETWTERPGLTALPSADEWFFPPRPDTHHVRWLSIDPADPERLYVGIEAGAFVLSTDGGEHWQERPPGARLDNHALATHPDAPGRVYAAAGDGYAESTDGGSSFEHPQDGLDHRYCWSVTPDPQDPDTIVLSAASGPWAAHSQPAESYVYRRAGDEPWTVAMNGLPGPDGSLRAVLAPGRTAGEIYLLSNHGLYRSQTAGQDWTRLPVDWSEAYTNQRPCGLVAL